MPQAMTETLGGAGPDEVMGVCEPASGRSEANRCSVWAGTRAVAVVTVPSDHCGVDANRYPLHPLARQRLWLLCPNACAPELQEATRGHGMGRNRLPAVLLPGAGRFLHR